MLPRKQGSKSEFMLQHNARYFCGLDLYLYDHSYIADLCFQKGGGKIVLPFVGNLTS